MPSVSGVVIDDPLLGLRASGPKFDKRLLVPYAAGGAVEELRARLADMAEFVDVSGDDEAYWRLLREWWSKGQTFVAIEHDVLVGPERLDELRACRVSTWCQIPTYINGSSQVWADALHCSKFSQELIARHPDALDLPPQQRHWTQVGQGLGARLREAPHFHYPAVEHRPTSPESMILSPPTGTGVKLLTPMPVSDEFVCSDCGRTMPWPPTSGGPGRQHCADCDRFGRRRDPLLFDREEQSFEVPVSAGWVETHPDPARPYGCERGYVETSPGSGVWIHDDYPGLFWNAVRISPTVNHPDGVSGWVLQLREEALA